MINHERRKVISGGISLLVAWPLGCDEKDRKRDDDLASGSSLFPMAVVPPPPCVDQDQVPEETLDRLLDIELFAQALELIRTAKELVDIVTDLSELTKRFTRLPELGQLIEFFTWEFVADAAKELLFDYLKKHTDIEKIAWAYEGLKDYSTRIRSAIADASNSERTQTALDGERYLTVIIDIIKAVKKKIRSTRMLKKVAKSSGISDALADSSAAVSRDRIVLLNMALSCGAGPLPNPDLSFQYTCGRPTASSPQADWETRTCELEQSCLPEKDYTNVPNTGCPGKQRCC